MKDIDRTIKYYNDNQDEYIAISSLNGESDILIYEKKYLKEYQNMNEEDMKRIGFYQFIFAPKYRVFEVFFGDKKAVKPFYVFKPDYSHKLYVVAYLMHENSEKEILSYLSKQIQGGIK